MSCSFFNIAGGICGADERSSSSTSIIPFTKCDKEIQKHKKFLKFSGVQTEVELILARCGCFEKPSNFLEMTICPAHRARLGIGWRRPSCFGSLQGPSESTSIAKRDKFVSIHEVVGRYQSVSPCGLR